MTVIESGVTVSNGVTFTPPPPGPTLYTVSSWEIGFVFSSYLLQFTCLDNTSAPYTILANLPIGSTIVLVQAGGNLTITTGSAPNPISGLNRVSYQPVTGYAGPNITGTQLVV